MIDPDPDQMSLFLREIAKGFYVDPARALDSLRRRLSFNVIETESSSKIDLIIRKDRPFSREELSRRRPAALWPETPVALASPEDTILSKLEWVRKAGGSEKQLEDAAGIVAVNPGLDRAYVEQWATELGVLDLWQQIEGARDSRLR